MDNGHFGGIVMIATGLGMSAIVGLWVLLAYRKHGPSIWGRAGYVTLFAVCWALSLALTIAGVVLVSKPDKGSRHASLQETRKA
jgi:hypothetical protein